MKTTMWASLLAANPALVEGIHFTRSADGEIFPIVRGGDGPVETPTLNELRAGIEWIDACLERMHADAGTSALSTEDQTRWDEGMAERQRLHTAHEALAARHQQVIDLARNRPSAVETGNGPAHAPNLNLNRNANPFDLSELRMGAPVGEVRDRAFAAIEHVPGISDENRAAAEALVRRHDTPRGDLSLHILATGSEAYRTGWQKLVAGQERRMTPEEQTAVFERAAMSLTDANGGYAVPFTLDPTIIDTRDGSANPFRRISSIRTTVTDQWAGVTSGGMSVSWDGEAAEAADGSPTFGNAPIPVHKAQGFAMGSIEITQDFTGLEADLRETIANAKDDAEAAVFATGSGSARPTGIIKALDGTASEVAPTTAETFAVADLYKLEEALPPRYRLAMLDGSTGASNRASFVANKAIYNKVRQFGTSDSHALWERLGAGQPPQLLGYSAYEASAMDGSWNAAATADNFVLVIGDFRYYVIVDRIGLSVEFIPHVFGDNGRPKGQRGWYCYWRVGADSVNDNAFRVLNIETTA